MSVTGCNPGEEARIWRTVRNSSAPIPAAKRKVIGASSRTRAVPLVSDPFVVLFGTAPAFSGVSTFTFCAVARMVSSRLSIVPRIAMTLPGSRACATGDVGLVPKHNLERAGQVFEKDNRERFALFLGKLAIHLRNRARDRESGAIGQLA